MNAPRKTLCVAYALIALLALVGTWGHNLQYLSLGPIGGTLHFWRETLVNPASRSITVDIFFYSLSVTLWMVMEARRLGMRGVWIYVLLGVLIAVSFTFPLFMCHRERALAALDGSAVGGALTRADAAVLLLVALVVVAFTVRTFLT
jgi:hypothetical protein